MSFILTALTFFNSYTL